MAETGPVDKEDMEATNKTGNQPLEGSKAKSTVHVTKRQDGLLLLGSAAALFASLFGTYLAWYVFALRCGENCPDRVEERPAGLRHWWLANDSWQWTFQFLVAIGGLVAAAFFVYFVVRRNYKAGALCFAVAVLFWLVWGAFLLRAY